MHASCENEDIGYKIKVPFDRQPYIHFSWTVNEGNHCRWFNVFFPRIMVSEFTYTYGGANFCFVFINLNDIILWVCLKLFNKDCILQILYGNTHRPASCIFTVA